uniref:Uncharacterized protein n=1 Tax=Loxodonta africana TaxID=9785 RepID=G3UNJ0_LOXAF
IPPSLPSFTSSLFPKEKPTRRGRGTLGNLGRASVFLEALKEHVRVHVSSVTKLFSSNNKCPGPPHAP